MVQNAEYIGDTFSVSHVAEGAKFLAGQKYTI